MFMLAIIAVIGVAMSATGGFNGSMVNADRISAELRSQGDLIKNKIRECYMNFNAVDHSGATGYPSTNFPVSSGSGTDVENLVCPTYGTGNQNLWSGQSQVLLPPPTKGFDKWVYVNAGDVNGRCIRIQPSAGFATDSMVHEGLSLAAGGFSEMERVYDSASASQRLIIWITRPTGAASPDCSS